MKMYELLEKKISENKDRINKIIPQINNICREIKSIYLEDPVIKAIRENIDILLLTSTPKMVIDLDKGFIKEEYDKETKSLIDSSRESIDMIFKSKTVNLEKEAERKTDLKVFLEKEIAEYEKQKKEIERLYR